VEVNPHGQIWGTASEFHWRDWKKQKSTFSITVVMAEFWNGHLPNASEDLKFNTPFCCIVVYRYVTMSLSDFEKHVYENFLVYKFFYLIGNTARW
jgi:hypothetical protein